MESDRKALHASLHVTDTKSSSDRKFFHTCKHTPLIKIWFQVRLNINNNINFYHLHIYLSVIVYNF